MPGHRLPQLRLLVPELNLRQLYDRTEMRYVTKELAIKPDMTQGGLAWACTLIAAHYKLSNLPRRKTHDQT